MSLGRTDDTLSSSTSPWLTAHIDHVLSLPEPGVEYTKREAVDEHGTPEHVVYHSRAVSTTHGVMEPVGRTERGRGEGGSYWVEVWRTNREKYTVAKRYREGRATLPCGHRSGFETVAAGERYECGFVACSKTYGRETVAEVFG